MRSLVFVILLAVSAAANSQSVPPSFTTTSIVPGSARKGTRARRPPTVGKTNQLSLPPNVTIGRRPRSALGWALGPKPDRS